MILDAATRETVCLYFFLVALGACGTPPPDPRADKAISETTTQADDKTPSYTDSETSKTGIIPQEAGIGKNNGDKLQAGRKVFWEQVYSQEGLAQAAYEYLHILTFNLVGPSSLNEEGIEDHFAQWARGGENGTDPSGLFELESLSFESVLNREPDIRIASVQKLEITGRPQFLRRPDDRFSIIGVDYRGNIRFQIYRKWITFFSPPTKSPGIPTHSVTVARPLTRESPVLAHALLTFIEADTFHVMELQYADSLEPTYSAKNVFSKLTGFKISENDNAGEKVADYYFVWPGDLLSRSASY